MKNLTKISNGVNKKIFSFTKISGFTLIIFVVLAVLAAGRTLAVNLSFNNLTYDQPTLRLKNSTQGTSDWTSPVSANPGDVIRFLVYYHCGGSETYPSTDQALNTKIRLTIPTTLETKVMANGRVWADNAVEATGIVEINVSSAQKLIFQNTAIWYRNQISSDISINTGNGYAQADIGNILCDPNDSYGNAGFVIFTANINNPPVANAGTDKDIFEGQTTVLDGSGFDLDNNPLTYLWTCDGGSLSDNQIAKPIFTPPAITQDTTYNCTLKVTDIHGSNHSDAMTVLVRKHTFSVNLSANPVSGTAPLNGVSFTAQVSGTATGLMNYIFYCNRNDSGTNITPGWAHRVDATNTNPLAANNICNYTVSGAYTAKVIVERAGIAAEKRITINVEEPLVFNAMADDQEVLRLKNQTKNTPEWIDTISAEPNDIIRFNVYYHCGVNSTTAPTQQARNTRIRISTADALQTKITPNVRISADNAFEKNDGSTINVSSSQKLIFDHTAKWYHAGAIDDIQVETGGDPYAEANLGNINADTLGRFDNAGFVIFTATVSNVFANHPPVANAGPDKDVFEAQSVILSGSGTDADGDTLTYSWSCASGSLSNPLIAQPTYTAPLVNTDTDYTCTLTVNDGKGGQASDATKITVKNQTLAVSLTANPASGNAPLTGVDLTADISGTAIGTINYIFYCNRADSGTNVTSGWARQIEGTNVDPFTANDVCNYTASGTYTAKVIVERGTAAAEDRIVINVSQPNNNPPLVSAGPDKEVFENQVVVLQGSASDPDGDSLTYSWNCTGGSLSNSQTPQPTYLAPAVTSDTDYTCTFTVTDSRNGSASDNVLVKVKNQTLSVSLTANPASGTAPLFGVDLTADVSGTAPGTINYIFYCNRSDSGTNVTSGWAFRQDGTNTDPLIINDVCDYTSSGSYTAKVIAERGALSAEARATITVSGSPVPTVDIKANNSDGPITVFYKNNITLSWTSENAASCQASGDWSGTKAISGSETIQMNQVKTHTFTLACRDVTSTKTGTDSVTVVVNPNPPVVITKPAVITY